MSRWVWFVLVVAACSPSHRNPKAALPPGASRAPATSPVATHESDPLREAAAYFANRPVPPLDDRSILVEGEELHVDSGAWTARPYGTNYYASTFANCFLSRKGYLGAPEQSEPSTASIDVAIPKAGRYLALVRYETAYRFHSQFRVRIEQKGTKKLERLYGARDNLRIYAFGNGKNLQKEIVYGWGATETIAWEGHDAFVDLEPGVAHITLIADEQPEPAARRNVDAILLTSDVDDVNERIAKERYLPLDGLLTQAGDVYLRATNRGPSPLTLTIPPATEHSPYWVHVRKWKKLSLDVAPGQSTEWTEVGSLLDTLNDGQWSIAAKGKGKEPLLYDLEFGVHNADGTIDSIHALPGITADTTSVGYYANTRHSRRLTPIGDVLYDLVAALKTQKVHGRPLSQTLFFAYSFPPQLDDPKYEAARQSFFELMGATALDRDEPGHLVRAESPPRGYIDVRGVPTDKLEDHARKLQAEGKAEHVAVISLGDEIGLPTPPANGDEAFRAWLKSRHVSPRDLDPESNGRLDQIRLALDEGTKKSKPLLYYQSKIYSYRYGIDSLRKRTTILERYFPHAGIGANFSPHSGHHYLGSTHQWISLFREGAMTMPWSEDYIFMSAVGSPQNNMLSVDMLRAGIRGKPGAKIDYYVMPHAPNNTPDAWRRQLFGDIAHGVKIFDLFEFRPVQMAYTENYVNSYAMYREIRQSIHELGTFEDLVQAGSVKPGVAALWFSEAADVWDDHESPFDADERALYLALRHRQIPLDVVTEDESLKPWSVIYLTDRHVSRAASLALARWVEGGGRLVATAGAGMFDESNRPNLTLRKLFGVEPEALEIDTANLVHFEKQDLPFATPIDHVNGSSGLPVLSARQRFTAAPAIVTATFDDGSPAIASRPVKKGIARYLGFLPGLAYLKPAFPKRPVDRSPEPDSMTHLLPTAIDARIPPLLWFDEIALPLTVSAPFVEASMVESPKGLLIPIVDWSGPLKSVTLTLATAAPGTSATLASGKPVTVSADRTSFTFDLDVADALVLR